MHTTKPSPSRSGTPPANPLSNRKGSRRISSLDSSGSRKGSLMSPASSKRKIVNAAPVQVVPVVRSHRSHNLKVVPPDTDKVFKFSCSGEIGGDSQLAGKNVKWDASFNLPIEQFIYPSLQRFDCVGYDEKVKEYKKRYGHTPRNYTQTQSEAESQAPNFIDPNKIRHIKLEPLPDYAAPYNENIMFLSGPKWTLNLSESQTQSAVLNEHGYRDTTEEINVEGEHYLKQKISKHYREVERDRVERERLGSAGFSVRRRGLHRIDPSPALEESANTLYTSLMKQQRQKEVQAAVLAHAVTSEHDSEVASFNNLRRDLLNTVPKSHTHLLDGIHYYRFMHDSHQAQMAEKKAVEQARMNTLPVQRARKQSVDSFANRLFRRKASQQSSVPAVARRSSIEPVAVREDDDEEDDDDSDSSDDSGSEGCSKRRRDLTSTAKKEKQRKKKHDEKAGLESMYSPVALSRVQRAIETKNVGLGTVGKPNEKLVSGSGSVGSGPYTPQKLFDGALVGEAENFEKSPYEKILAKTSRRRAQDLLLLTQLDEGILPEKFLKPGTGTGGRNRDEDTVAVMLSKYGIGDTRGICLGRCFSVLHNLESVGLSDNRLTALSLPTIIENLAHSTLTALDLSFNSMSDHGVKALAAFLRGKTVLQDLDISSCGINCEDVKVLSSSLMYFPNKLEELRLSCNKIAVDGTRDLCGFLVSSKTCVLKMLDLSWNAIGEQGAICIGGALRLNRTLEEVNLASNAIGDYGGQRLLSNLRNHPCMTSFILSQNEIADCTCFVASQVLQGHPSMKRLDLTFNPLGEAGARSIYRRILRGLGCWVMMGNCAFGDNPKAFNSTYPSADNPYTLDLAEPYQAAVLAELLTKFREDPVNCSFEGMGYREGAKGGPEMPISLIVQNGEVCLKGTGQPWQPPESGTLRFSFEQSVFVPTLANAIDAKSFDVLQKIVEAGKAADRKKDVDKKRTWLYLLCQDAHFTTEQATSMIERFEKNKTIGDGELSKLDVIKSVWRFLLDTENMYTFLYENTTKEQRKDLVYALTLKRYKFNWANPTGNWRLTLNDKVQRAIMMQIIAINNSESDFSKNHSGREDTSQNGNWFNFRNSKYTVDGETRPIVIDKDFVKNLPLYGKLEFDYVSTSRPPKLPNPHEVVPTRAAARRNRGSRDKLPSATDASSDLRTSSRDSTDGADAGAVVLVGAGAGIDLSMDVGAMKDALDKFWGGDSAADNAAPPVNIATDDDFHAFCQRLSLSSRKKVPASGSLFVLLDLQLACTKHYFTVEQVLILLDCFADDWYVHSQVIVCMFSRIYDLHRIDILLRSLDSRTQQNVLKRIGYLNVINPLKISFDYVLDLMFLDNRVMVISLMELAAVESADQIVEESNTELPIAALYGAYNRTLNETRPEIMRFQFTDFGKHTKNVAWGDRRNMMRKFLVGTQPVDESAFYVLAQYKEMEAAGKLTEGPIDQQYLNFQKSQASARLTKSTSKMMGLMRMTKSGKQLK